MRLIDANALRKQMFSYYGCVNENTSKSTYTGETLMNYEVADLIEDSIENAPTVDAVEAVRCKDCKHFDRLFKEKGAVNEIGTCYLRKEEGIETAQICNDFCSYGERREGE